MKKTYDLDFFKKIAAEKEGACLSTEYLGLHAYLKFRCKIGHDFQTRPKKIIYDESWCPLCRGQHYSEHSLLTFQLIAKKNGGECLSDKYNGIRNKLHFKCHIGHEWSAIAHNILHQKSWCPICAKAKNERFKKPSSGEMLKQIQTIAKERLGKCLSTEYLGDKVHLKFECADGHQWEATPNTIKRPHWCPVCKNGRKK